MKAFLKAQFPRAFAAARDIKDRARMEYYVVRRLSWRHLFPGLQKATSWQSVLPYQGIRRIEIPQADFPTVESIKGCVEAAGLKHGNGVFALYLPPETVAGTPFKVLKNEYPPDAGVKLLKVAGFVGESMYGLGIKRKEIDRHLLLAANMLYNEGLGPRIYDLVELVCGSQIWTAYVMRHVQGREPTAEECETGVAKMRRLEEEGTLMTIATGAHRNIDFLPPSCNGNAIIDEDGKFQYVDFQNFVTGNYSKYLDQVARTAVDDSHFGDKRLLGGGRILYQSIPGVNMPAKRSVESRSTMFTELLQKAGVQVRDRLMLDVGCNIGMMIAEYLKWGAKWCHGWDFPNVVPHTERLLSGLGCTRYSTTGAQLKRDRRLEDDLPDWLGPSVQGCGLSYLAVHGHIGWMESIARIPWSFMIYEGHEFDTRADVERYLGELRNNVSFEIGAMTSAEDGASNERTAAILLRSER